MIPEKGSSTGNRDYPCDEANVDILPIAWHDCPEGSPWIAVGDGEFHEPNPRKAAKATPTAKR